MSASSNLRDWPMASEKYKLIKAENKLKQIKSEMKVVINNDDKYSGR